MTNRNYSSTAAATTLSSGINASVTSLVVGATTGFPAAPFILVIDPEQAAQELVLVTAAAGTTLTVTRGYDSTSAASHSAGAVVKHAHAAVDFRDSRTHENASAGVHGVTGSVVGTSDTQALTNKTLGTTNTINGFTASKVMVSDGTGKLVASTSATPAGSLVGTTDTQVLTNKDLSSATNTFPAALATDAEVTSAVSAHNSATVAHGAAGAVVGTTNTQTLTNKTLTSPTINGGTITTPSISNPTITGISAVALSGTLNTTDWNAPSVATLTPFGPFAFIQVAVVKKGATITANSSGNITDTAIFTSVSLAPSAELCTGVWHCSGLAAGTWVLTSTGQLLLTNADPNSSISSGDKVTLSGWITTL